MIGRLPAWWQAHRFRTDIPGETPEQLEQRLVAFHGDRGATKRFDRAFDIGKGNQRVKRGSRRARRTRRIERGGGKRAAGVGDRLASVETNRVGHLRDGVVWHGEEDEIDVVDQLLAALDRPCARDEAGETGAAIGVARRDPRNRPPGSAERDSECRSRVAGTDDPDPGQPAGIVWRVGMPVAEHPLDAVIVGRVMVMLRVMVVLTVGRLVGVELPGRVVVGHRPQSWHPRDVPYAEA